MRNPWRMQDGPDNKINRNNFPMSFQYNGTFKYGKIYPIGLWRTIPGASYQIDSTLALNFMPTSFPIQTRQRAYVHFFYGRDRNFWKDYKDFVNGMSPDLVKPYIDEGVTKARTGNLLDYLGVPTTLVGDYGRTVEENISSFDGDERIRIIKSAFTTGDMIPMSQIRALTTDSTFVIGRDISPAWSDAYAIPLGDSSIQKLVVQCLDNGNKMNINEQLFQTPNPDKSSQPYTSPTPIQDNKICNWFYIINTDGNDTVLSTIFGTPSSDNLDLIFENVPANSYLLVPFVIRGYYAGVDIAAPVNKLIKFLQDGLSINLVQQTFDSRLKDIDERTSPYWRSSDPRGKNTIKLSAIPCRFYETVYNLYYRNPQNNPYILNGKPEYNVFIPTKDGGPDSNLYELRYRNWEDDFLTTAVQTPQQGIAPLVGLTDRGATVTLTNEDGSVTRYKTNLDDYGNVTGIETTDSSEPLLTQALIDAVSYGISIEDLRNVNAMQKWLELNLRKGYQYKDIIEARWGISISYNELDLPEFIGGFTQEVGLQAVTQTTSHGDTIEGSLGWQAGRMYASGSGRSITHYCEEEGYIMALLCVVPVPNYSQLLPKHWFTRDLLESYQPEFNHIGFQPITYKEVCPIQAFQESTENVDVLEQTFGYQRPWYEYFNQVDEVHGQFRTTFKDFLINRTFDVKPELSESFLLVDPNQVNDVFAVQTDDDKIIGAIEHRITAKLPISLYAQARLE